MTSPLIIAPSVLACDFGKLADEIAAVDRAGADWIHLDVMDGHFVPNLSFGPPIINAVRNATAKVFDTHLMVSNPDALLAEYAAAGSQVITVHAEACTHLHRTLGAIRELGCKAGVSLNPATPESVLQYVLDQVDMVLVMSVNPGFGGQKFITEAANKVRRIRSMLGDRPVHIQVDGGVTAETAPLVYRAGADVLVAGSAVFKGGNEAAYTANINAIRAACQ